MSATTELISWLHDRDPDAGWETAACQDALAALDELAARVDCGGANCGKCQQCLTVNSFLLLGANENLRAENQRLREEIRIREESQIPVIPRGAQQKMERLEAENQRLKSEAEDMVLAAAYHEMCVLRNMAVAENQQLREEYRYWQKRAHTAERALRDAASAGTISIVPLLDVDLNPIRDDA
jgi:hypothetical protein